MPALRCPSLKALVAELVVAQVDLCHALVDLKGLGEGLQSWHDAHGQVHSFRGRFAAAAALCIVN